VKKKNERKKRRKEREKRRKKSIKSQTGGRKNPTFCSYSIIIITR